MENSLTNGHMSSQIVYSFLVQRQQAPILQEVWLKQVQEWMMWVLLGIIVVQLLLWVRVRFSRGPFTDEEVEQADPLFLAYLRSKGQLKLKDTQATMFHLTRKGILSMRVVKTKGRYRNDLGKAIHNLDPKQYWSTVWNPRLLTVRRMNRVCCNGYSLPMVSVNNG